KGLMLSVIIVCCNSVDKIIFYYVSKLIFMTGNAKKNRIKKLKNNNSWGFTPSKVPTINY
ncbi:TPA: hypothetical protein ACIYJV_005689, partial [Escherichia coli]